MAEDKNVQGEKADKSEKHADELQRRVDSLQAELEYFRRQHESKLDKFDGKFNQF